ncbi:uncharacterized protein BKA55DRAFT_667639 [Fusarium redolens]|uniref:Uncharacterized protein n=1 Tax=Fusarium redolens TaxID=48865 RepID=A0A9P9JMI9_FUSRE|nr:uncharacterized protein BKA55DRAFT_667639 [Fusarium redolens]KAH7230487.1 hypothetical protein BKA55DRAFT_667639 [Fusarium redolens]
MSVLFVLVYILKGKSLRRCLSKTLRAEDVAFLELFSRILMGRESYADEVSSALEQGIELEWEDVYDFVYPFGDTRVRAFNSVWTFDLDKDVLFHTKHDRPCSAPLSLARDRPLTLDDFELVQSPTQLTAEEQTVPGPYWDLQLDVDHRKRAFLGRILRDFGHTWRHLLRRQVNNVPFMKLAYAVIWILNIGFTIVERTGFEHVGGRGGRYAGAADLPQWDTPDEPIVQVGSCWFVLARDIPKGLDMIREHMESHAAITDSKTQQIICCKVHDGELVHTRPESLFGDAPPSGSAIDLILWASDIYQGDPKPSRLNYLPVKIQDRVLRQAATSSVAAAKLGIELSLGSPFSWAEQRRKIRLEETLRHRTEASPVETQICFNRTISGFSYKCEAAPMGCKVERSSLPAPPRPKLAVGRP